jgi:hypothetical protein
MPEMAGVLRTRAAEETSALAPAAGASFSSRPASQRLDCGRGRTRIQNFISVSVETRSVHADSPLEDNAFSSNQGRHCEQGSGEANQGSERRRSFRTGYVKARQGSEGRPSRLDRHVALARRKTGVFRRIWPLVQDDCSIASQQFNLLAFRTIEYILFIRKSPSSVDGL